MRRALGNARIAAILAFNPAAKDVSEPVLISTATNARVGSIYMPAPAGKRTQVLRATST